MNSIEIASPSDFGRAVRLARKEAGISQTRLAELSGCSQRLISEIERGKSTAEIGKALSLLNALDVPLIAGSPSARLDGRAQVEYAIVRIASELESSPRKHRALADYLDGAPDA